MPLYTLETGIPLYSVDIMGFSIGYELGLTTVLAMLDLGKIPLDKNDRVNEEPLIIAGGCGVTNPLPISRFFDAVFIGEAENELFELVSDLAQHKKKGAKRSDLLKILKSHPAIWIKGKKARRAVQNDFGRIPSIPAYFPIPSVKPVQDHGVVEIMRGCPNGCRFCHAGIYYRPWRMKNEDIIMAEVADLVEKAGYKEISLSSLSSGDFLRLGKLLDRLNEKYKNSFVSFQLPSLKVNSFTLPILEKLANVRKSGLTFAVETPVEAWQFSINKEVFAEKLFSIIMNAKKSGWNKAKFYFMIGLPVKTMCNLKIGETGSEEREIVDFMLKIQALTGIQCNVNIGIFVPKPHTAYQWAKQLSIEEARQRLSYIRSSLPRGRFRVSTHDEFVSFIEGMLSRGDERVADIVLFAYKGGCRLDAWDEHLQKNIWKTAITEANWNVENEICRSRSLDEKLPWNDVSLGPTKSFYKKEHNRSISQSLTAACAENCCEPCGICGKKTQVRIFNSPAKTTDDGKENSLPPKYEQNIPALYRVIFSFSKKNGGEYIPHLALIEIFYKAFARSGLPIMYSGGFNPVPRFELASSLSLGIISECELASCLLRYPKTQDEFLQKMRDSLPASIEIDEVFIFPVSREIKRESLASLLWGSRYLYSFFLPPDQVYAFLHSPQIEKLLCNEKFLYDRAANCLDIFLPFKKDRFFRDSISEYFARPLYLCAQIIKKESLACHSFAKNDYRSYFEIYKDIAIRHADVILV